MKKIAFLILIFVAFLVLGTAKVNAAVEVTQDAKVIGAQIRTTGNAGIRFVGKMDDASSLTPEKYGIVLAFGEALPSDDFVINGTVNAKQTVYAEVDSLDPSGQFYVTLYNVPESFYTQDITARAFVVDGESYIYSDEVVTRSLYQVAKALEDQSDDFINNIITKSEYDVNFIVNGGVIEDSSYTKTYPESITTMTIGKMGMGGYGASDTLIHLLCLPAIETVDDPLLSTTRVGITYDEEVEEYVVDQVLNPTDDIRDYQTSDFFLVVNTSSSYNNLVSSLEPGNIVVFDQDITKLLDGDINVTLSSYTNETFEVNYKKAFTSKDAILPVPYRHGYHFAGWYTTSDFQGDKVTEFSPSLAENGLNLYAKWTIITYNINYVLNDGVLSNVNHKTYNVASGNITLSNPTKKGYTFLGWIGTDLTEATKEVVISNGSTGNRSYEAKWELATYKITYNLNGGINNTNNIFVYTIKSNTFKLYDPTKPNYVFSGWYLNSQFIGEAVTEVTQGSIGNITLYAKWQGATSGLEYTLVEGKYCVTGYTGSSDSIIIPSTYRGVEVSSIGASAFKGNTNITSVLILEGVTSIGQSAFSNCTSLITITIPSSITSIGNSAFYNCTSIEEINYNAISCDDLKSGCATFEDAGKKGNGITLKIGRKVTKIPAYIFSYSGSFSSSDHTRIVNVIFEEGSRCESIGRAAFSYCRSLTSINIPEGVTSIGQSAFSNCTSLINVTIPSSITSIGNSAFYNCTSIEEINYNAIACSDLESGCATFEDAGKKGNGITLKIGRKVTKIPAYIFSYSGSFSTSDYTRIVSVIFEEGSRCESIGRAAFSYCRSLTSINIPEGVTSIGQSAFSNCTSLINVTIPSSITSIGNSAFYNCTSIEEINYNAIACSDLESGCATFEDAGKKGNGITLKIGRKVTKIPAYIFSYSGSFSTSDYTRIVSVIFEEGSRCESIGRAAFLYCRSLTSITIPSSVTSIDRYAFSKCTSLANVTIKSSVIIIAEDAFNGCPVESNFQ